MYELYPMIFVRVEANKVYTCADIYYNNLEVTLYVILMLL